MFDYPLGSLANSQPCGIVRKFFITRLPLMCVVLDVGKRRLRTFSLCGSRMCEDFSHQFETLLQSPWVTY